MLVSTWDWRGTLGAAASVLLVPNLLSSHASQHLGTSQLGLHIEHGGSLCLALKAQDEIF